VLRRLFRGKKDGIVLVDHNDLLHFLYFSPDTTIMIKSRRIKWAEHVVRMYVDYWWESQRAREQ
jgi:hypothetical protein